jgi:formylglycine-generating enzyme
VGKVSEMKKAILIACVAILGFDSVASAKVNIETVPVGNVGNTGDTKIMKDGTTGHGYVGYTYNIGKYEVTAAQYTGFLNAVARTDTYGLYHTHMSFSYLGCRIKRSGSSGDFTYSVDTDRANRPVNYVSWGDAARFANWLHNGQPTGGQDLSTTEDGAYYLNGATSMWDLQTVDRESDWKWAIPTEDEWYKAAYYNPATSSYYDYPTSSNSTPGYITNSGNFSGTGESFGEGGIDPGNYATYDDDGGGNAIGPPYWRTEAGEWENSDSPYGTFDQCGNVQEWTEFIFGSSYRGLRGGGYSGNAPSLAAPSFSNGTPTDEGAGYGFRVVEVPEPATLSLLTLGGLSIMRRRKRGACK